MTTASATMGWRSQRLRVLVARPFEKRASSSARTTRPPWTTPREGGAQAAALQVRDLETGA
jgi:hypothetical protein